MIAGYRISSISAQRRNAVAKRIDINSTPRITSVEKRGKDLAIGFEFLMAYNPDIGQINIAGELLYRDKGAAAEFKKWKSEGKLSEKVDIEVKNFLFRKCLSLGVALSEQLQLPPPVMFPFLVQKKEQPENTTYIG